MPNSDRLILPTLADTLERLRSSIYTPLSPLEAEFWVTPEPRPFARRMEGAYRKVAVGESWGSLWDCAWVRFRGEIGTDQAGMNLALLIDLSGELCVVDALGEPARGLTTASSEFDQSLGRPAKTVFPLPGGTPGGSFELWADAACNDLFGKYPDSGRLKQASLAVCDEELRGLTYDFEVLLELMGLLPADKARRGCLMRALHRASLLLDEIRPDRVLEARRILAPELSRRAGDPGLALSAVGHAHIDLAWLWPLRETPRKGARTFSTALALMETYPDYVFGASQAQLYQWIKTEYPGLYGRIKERVAEGRWEVQGGMWVEADTNLPSGESLARQFLYGKRFFRSEFDRDMKILWLPDVFGYSASLPQIMEQAGVDYFMTAKLSWNKFNSHPHHSFLWEGLGGKRVLVHMPPEGTYNSSAAPRAVAAAEREFKDKGVCERALLVFGIGDGGGGPGEEHLERLAREKDLQGLVPVTQQSALDFFLGIDRLGVDWGVWSGELYFEMHQGTYTTQGRIKRWNRRMEVRLRETELILAAAWIHAGHEYPHTDLEEIWKEVLLYQFHDILPGSSIGRVYREAEDRYAILAARLDALQNAAMEALAARGKQGPVAVNCLPFDRVLRRPATEGDLLVPALASVPADAVTIRTSSGPESLYAEGGLFENDKLRVEFSSDGTLVSLIDKKTGRECLDPAVSAGNALIVYHDSGDAWDFPVDYRDRIAGRFEPVGTEVLVEGERLVRRTEYRFGRSRLFQDVVLARGARRLDFVTAVDWRERRKMLRASFGCAVRSTEAECDIAFGRISRPTVRNTSWDEAKFEICAHQWVSLREGGFGVALLNDGKYGYHVEPGLLDLNLLRSPVYPDEEADQGAHEFTYAFLPHRDLVEVDQEAADLNSPLFLGAGGPFPTLVAVDNPAVSIDAVKVAEEGGALIVRLHEESGARSRSRLVFGFPCVRAARVNLLEEEERPIELRNGTATLVLDPFELATLKIEVGTGKRS